MYLTAFKIDSQNTFDKWKGKSGKFVRTFGLNTKRNKNEWRVSWQSIKRHINTAINRPGIEFEKCEGGKCDLDHVEAETFESVIKKQKPFERTKIIDYVLNEETETVDLIHEVLDDEFFEKLKSGEIQYVSAMVWPATGGYEVHGRGRADLPIVDAEHWRFVHHAFLRDNPAYGKDTATVKTTCEGSNCQVQMLSSKQITTCENDPLANLPLLIKHQNNIHLVSASKLVQDEVMKNKKDGNIINDNLLVKAYSKYKESNKKNSPFKSCTCTHSVSKMDDTEKTQFEMKLKASEDKNKEMESKLKSNTEEKEKDMESKMKARKAKYGKLFSSEKSDEDAKTMHAKLSAMSDDDDDLKAMDESLKESNKARKSATEDPEKKEMKATMKAMQSKLATPLIASLVDIRKGKMPQAELVEYEKALSSKSYNEIQTEYDNESYLINSLSSKSSGLINSPHYEFNGGESLALSSKTLEELATGGGQ